MLAVLMDFCSGPPMESLSGVDSPNAGLGDRQPRLGSGRSVRVRLQRRPPAPCPSPWPNPGTCFESHAPWARSPNPRSRNSCVNVMSDNGLPVRGLGNIRLLPQLTARFAKDFEAPRGQGARETPSDRHGCPSYGCRGSPTPRVPRRFSDRSHHASRRPGHHQCAARQDALASSYPGQQLFALAHARLRPAGA